MPKRKYRVRFELETTVEFDDSLMPDDEWRSMFYPIHTEADLAEHLAYNFLFNGAKLSRLDGFADRDNSLASLPPGDFEPRECIVYQEATEVKDDG